MGVVDIFELEDANDMVRENGGVVADYKPVLLGITKGIPCHRQLPLGGFVPGDHESSHRCFY